MNNRISLLRRLRSPARKILATSGLGFVFYVALEINDYQKLRSSSREKNVLVIPFHRMNIVEQKKIPLISALTSFSEDEKSMVVEMQELVDTIHNAASDHGIRSIYATFGHGFGFKCGGLAHIEEIRDAIRVFNESHRKHGDGRGESTTSDESIVKQSYAFADTFDNPLDSANKEYFLASAFSQICLQPRGSLHLYGLSIQNLFLADTFKIYGLKATVFRNGPYKNAGSIFTDSKYTKAHFQNNLALINSINKVIYDKISDSRRFPKDINHMWNAIHNYGTMTADNAQEIGLVDHLPNVNPLYDLVNVEDTDDIHMESLKKKWSNLFHTFTANKMIEYSEYQSVLQRKKKWHNRKIRLYQTLKHMRDTSSAFESLLNVLGCDTKYFGFDKSSVDTIYSKPSTDKIAVIHVSGTIIDKTAKSLSKSLREIKGDDKVKCIILRVDSPGGSVTASETIAEECKDVGKPIVCSFSNLAASGGYYISTHADRIFAQPTTLTGSIGVLSLKFDASVFAERHGVHTGSVTSSPHANTYSLLQPLTYEAKLNLKRSVDRIYWYFQKIVGEGRNLSPKEVHDVSQGRVWTGIEAKENGLVDELGGLERTISYAKKKFSSENAEVLVYPKHKTFLEAFSKMFEEQTQSVKTSSQSSLHSLLLAASDGISDIGKLSFFAPSYITLCMDEMSALESILEYAQQ